MKRKLTTKDVELMLTLFQQGWRQAHLRRKFCIDHSTVHYYVKRFHVVRNGEIFKMPPPEIQHTYIITVKSAAAPKVKNYADYLRESKEREAQRRRERMGLPVDRKYDPSIFA